MQTIRALALILLAMPTVFAEHHRYCFLDTCEPRNHTLCQFPRAGPRSSCGKRRRAGLAPIEIDLLLFMYNIDKPSVKFYAERQDREPTIEEINALSPDYSIQWDEELADIAQRWADQCVNGLDKCRNVDRFRVRQRVGRARTSKYIQPPTIYTIVSDWKREDQMLKLDNMDFANRCLHNISSMVSNYFSGMMLQYAERFGCGAVRTIDKHFQYVHLVCNFGPA